MTDISVQIFVVSAICGQFFQRDLLEQAKLYFYEFMNVKIIV